MATKGLMSALTLYRCGTFTCRQAASYAGQTDAEFSRTLSRYGISPESHN